MWFQGILQAHIPNGTNNLLKEGAMPITLVEDLELTKEI